MAAARRSSEVRLPRHGLRLAGFAGIVTPRGYRASRAEGAADFGLDSVCGPDGAGA
jgi:hypothetical protein